MCQQLVQITRLKSLGEEKPSKLLEIPLDKIPSEVLRRLVEEVKNDADGYERSTETIGMYTRFHNRHNRSGGGTAPYNRFHNRHNRSR